MGKDNIFINDRTIVLQGDIEDIAIGSINAEIIKLIKFDDKENSEKKNFKRKPIKLYINSCGGSIADMWSLIDMIQLSKTPIYTYCTGYAFSAGFMVFLSGHKKFVTQHATLMFHQILYSHGFEEHISHKQYSDQADIELKKITEYVLKRTNISESKINKVIKEKFNWYIQSEEAVKLGIADEIMKGF